MAAERSDPGEVLVGRRPVIELLRAGGSARRILIAEGTERSSTIAEIRRLAAAASIHVDAVPRGEVEKLARDANHQGVAAVTGRYRYRPLEDLLRRPGLGLLFLDHLTDPQNLGSLLRSADGAGFGGVVLPSHRSVQVTTAVRRASAGAAETARVSRVANLAQALEQAKSAGLWVLGLDAHATEDIWTSALADPPVALVLGAEDKGVSRVVRDRCDGFVRIPLAGRIGSLNVGVAGAIAMFETARRREHSATL